MGRKALIAVRLDKVEARESLPPRRDPYWQRLSEGRHLGYRRMKKSAEGSWLARYHNGETYVYKKPGLGKYLNLPLKKRFDAARHDAESWFKQLESGGSVHDAGSVADVCEQYVEAVRDGDDQPKHGRIDRERAAVDLDKRFRRLVYSDPLGTVNAAKARPLHFAAWRKRRAGMKERTLRRNVTSLIAAMNYALKERQLTTDYWTAKLAFTVESGTRELYLTVDERRRLLDCASGDARTYLQALMLLPFRPGDVALLRVSDLNVHHRVLRVPRCKISKERTIPLDDAAFTFFSQCAKGKLPSAWLVSNNGEQWVNYAWNRVIKEAAQKAGLPSEVCGYTLRHCLLTDLLTSAGLDLMTTAKISGTSTYWLEKTYGKLMADHARKALARLRV